MLPELDTPDLPAIFTMSEVLRQRRHACGFVWYECDPAIQVFHLYWYPTHDLYSLHEPSYGIALIFPRPPSIVN